MIIGLSNQSEPGTCSGFTRRPKFPKGRSCNLTRCHALLGALHRLLDHANESLDRLPAAQLGQWTNGDGPSPHFPTPRVKTCPNTLVYLPSFTYIQYLSQMEVCHTWSVGMSGWTWTHDLLRSGPLPSSTSATFGQDERCSGNKVQHRTAF